MMVPNLLFEPIIAGILDGADGDVKYAIQQGMAFVDCNEFNQFKPFKMMYSEYYITIDPEDYIWDAYGDKSVCTLLFLQNSYDFFLLGQPVYQGYYTTHDMQASTIAYTPLNGMTKPALQKAQIPSSLL
jgi:hypothetical protein